MGNGMSPEVTRKVLDEDGQYRTRTFVLKDYDPGRPGSAGYIYECEYCGDDHSLSVCPLQHYYDIVKQNGRPSLSGPKGPKGRSGPVGKSGPVGRSCTPKRPQSDPSETG